VANNSQERWFIQIYDVISRGWGVAVALLTLEPCPPTADRHFTRPQSLTIDVTFSPFVSYMQNFPYEDTRRKKYFDLRFLQCFQKTSLVLPLLYLNNERELLLLLRHFAKLRKKMSISLVMSVDFFACPNARNNSAPHTRRIFVKFHISVLFNKKICQENSSFIKI